MVIEGPPHSVSRKSSTERTGSRRNLHRWPARGNPCRRRGLRNRVADPSPPAGKGDRPKTGPVLARRNPDVRAPAVGERRGREKMLAPERLQEKRSRISRGRAVTVLDDCPWLATRMYGRTGQAAISRSTADEKYGQARNASIGFRCCTERFFCRGFRPRLGAAPDHHLRTMGSPGPCGRSHDFREP